MATPIFETLSSDEVWTATNDCTVIVFANSGFPSFRISKDNKTIEMLCPSYNHAGQSGNLAANPNPIIIKAGTSIRSTVNIQQPEIVIITGWTK